MFGVDCLSAGVIFGITALAMMVIQTNADKKAKETPATKNEKEPISEAKQKVLEEVNLEGETPYQIKNADRIIAEGDIPLPMEVIPFLMVDEEGTLLGSLRILNLEDCNIRNVSFRKDSIDRAEGRDSFELSFEFQRRYQKSWHKQSWKYGERPIIRGRFPVYIVKCYFVAWDGKEYTFED